MEIVLPPPQKKVSEFYLWGYIASEKQGKKKKAVFLVSVYIVLCYSIYLSLLKTMSCLNFVFLTDVNNVFPCCFQHLPPHPPSVLPATLSPPPAPTSKCHQSKISLLMYSTVRMSAWKAFLPGQKLGSEHLGEHTGRGRSWEWWLRTRQAPMPGVSLCPLPCAPRMCLQKPMGKEIVEFSQDF